MMLNQEEYFLEKVGERDLLRIIILANL